MKKYNIAQSIQAIPCILLLTCVAWMTSCDDTTDFLGSSVVEGVDNIEVKRKTFYPISSTTQTDTVFTRSSTAYIGKYTHPDFGSFESGFMTQFNVTENFEIPNLQTFVPVGGRTEFLNTPNVYNRSFMPKRFYVTGLYTNYFGDSLAVGRINVYRLTNDLDIANEELYYSNVDPEDYYQETDLLGSAFYSPVNLSIPEGDRLNNYLFTTIELPVAVGGELMQLYLDCHKQGKSFRDEFLRTFKGIYAKQVQGDGALLYLDQVRLSFTFDRYDVDDSGQPLFDSITTSTFAFSTTKEIVQVNTFRNNTPPNLLLGDSCTYLKSPAGLYTRVQIPIKEIADSIINQGDSINAVSFTMFIDTLQERIPQLKHSDHLLLIRDTATVNGVFHNYQKKFFADNQLPDNQTSYTAISGPKGYTFGDVRALIMQTISEYRSTGTPLPEYLNLLLIPVTITYDDGITPVGVSHNLTPSYTILQGGSNAAEKRIKLNVYYCRY